MSAESEPRSNVPSLRVTYMEAYGPPPAVPPHAGRERIARECLTRVDYLHLYRQVGEPLGWDQRLQLTPEELDRLLASPACRVYVLRDADAVPLGFCEFDRAAFPDVELKNFGLVRAAQGRGLGPWLLATALAAEWREAPQRVWLHTDTWDHPAAIRTYEKAAFRTYAVRDEPAGPL